MSTSRTRSKAKASVESRAAHNGEVDLQSSNPIIEKVQLYRDLSKQMDALKKEPELIRDQLIDYTLAKGEKKIFLPDESFYVLLTQTPVWKYSVKLQTARKKLEVAMKDLKHEEGKEVMAGKAKKITTNYKIRGCAK